MLIASIKKSNLYLAPLFFILIISCTRTQKTNEISNSSEKKRKIYNSGTDSSKKQIIKNSNYTLFSADTLDPSSIDFDTSGTSSIDFDTSDLKSRIINDDVLNNAFNFSAVSYNSEYVLVKFYNYSCCYHDGDFLRLYNQNKEVQTIQTSPEEDIEWTDVVFDSVKIKAKYLINKRNYYTMSPVRKYNVKTIEENSEIQFSIEVFLNNKVSESNSFKMDSIEYKNSGCCMGINFENDYDCKIPPKIINIWTDLHEKMILLEYGILNSSTGCDRGPFFKTVDLKI